MPRRADRTLTGCGTRGRMRHRAELFGLRHHAESRDPMSAMLYLRSTRVEGEQPADGDRQPGRNENRRYSNRDVRNVGGTSPNIWNLWVIRVSISPLCVVDKPSRHSSMA